MASSPIFLNSGRDFERTLLNVRCCGLRARHVWVVSGVVAVHLGGVLNFAPPAPAALLPEMTVSLLLEPVAVPPALMSKQTAPSAPLESPLNHVLSNPSLVKRSVTVVMPLPVATAPPSPAASPSLPLITAAAPTKPVSSVPAPPALPDREPDYQAGYLNNPRPAYPAMAVRMGWQGKVMLSVAVLRDGRAGQVSVQRSSGHAVLDDAALQAVRAWRFVPARHDGQLVDQTFLVPLPFILKDSNE